jgi:hypothetical protein
MITDAAREANSAMTRHDEWLVDEANRDSFPASDPASSTQPGSIVGVRYANGARAATASTVEGR